MNTAQKAALSLVLVLACFALVTSSVSLAQGAPAAQRPTIVSADANFQTNQITIAGSHFGTPKPYVALDGHAVTVVTHTPTTVVVDMPSNLAPGAYLLTLKNMSDGLTGPFDISLGVVGPKDRKDRKDRKDHRVPKAHKVPKASRVLRARASPCQFFM